jgi:hypothetical protein
MLKKVAAKNLIGSTGKNFRAWTRGGFQEFIEHEVN